MAKSVSFPNYIEERYEFSAPKYFDFSAGETPEEAAEAERWFEIPKTYLPSPFVAKSRSLLESNTVYSNDNVYNEVQKLIARISSEHREEKMSGLSGTTTENDVSEDSKVFSESREATDAPVIGCSDSKKISEVSVTASANDASEDAKDSVEAGKAIAIADMRTLDSVKTLETRDTGPLLETKRSSGKTESSSSLGVVNVSLSSKISASVSQEELGVHNGPQIRCNSSVSCSLVVGSLIGKECCGDYIANDTVVGASSAFEGTQKNNTEGIHIQTSQEATNNSEKSGASLQVQTAAGKLTANQDCSVIEKHETCVRQRAQMKKLKRPLIRSHNSKPEIPSTRQSHTKSQYANKRQKLEGGQTGQVHNFRENIRTVKAVPSLTVPQEFHFRTEERFQTHRGMHCQAFAQGGSPVSPYVPLAERVFKFQFGATERFHNMPENQPLKLTRPKEPDLLTSQRFRPPRVKSSAEIEQEMLVNMPKFKARPLNKKIFEAPTLPTLARSTPQLPEFQEFNLRTTERAVLHPSTSGKLASGSEIKFVSDSDKCGSMLKRGFNASSGHYVPTTSFKQKTIERMEEKRPLKRLRLSEYSSEVKCHSLRYNSHQEISHIQSSAQQNSHLALASTKTVLPMATTQTSMQQLPQTAVSYAHDSMGMQNSQNVIWQENMPNPSQSSAKQNSHLALASTKTVLPMATTQTSMQQLPQTAVNYAHDSRGMQNSQNVIWQENMPNPSQFISGSDQELRTSAKGTFRYDPKSIIREDAFVSEKKRKPLSEIYTPHSIQFGLKANNVRPTLSTLKGKAFHDQSSPASIQNNYVQGHVKEPLQIAAIQMQDSSLSTQDSQIAASWSVSRHMR